MHALGAIDIALWDIAGKAAGGRCWQLLGERAHETLAAVRLAAAAGRRRSTSTCPSLVDQVVRAPRSSASGRRSWSSSSTGPTRNMGLREPDERMTEVIRAVREAVGPEFALMVDVGYAWDTAERPWA